MLEGNKSYGGKKAKVEQSKGDWEWSREGDILNGVVNARWASVRRWDLCQHLMVKE